MKRYIGAAAVMIMAFLCASGCGKSQSDSSSSVKVSVESVNNKTVEELKNLYKGTWEVSVVFVDNRDGIAFDADRYQFREDGTGYFIPQNSKRELISWTVTPDGDLQVLLEERGEKAMNFEYVGGNLVNFEKEDRGVVETHLSKTEDINSEPKEK